ncbi:MAG: hypothetical protein AAF655_08250 [Bacteroidota bacterium]
MNRSTNNSCILPALNRKLLTGSKLIGMLMCLFFLTSTLLYGQAEMHVHMDKGFYVGGERIWYTLYLTRDDGLPLSQGTVFISWYNQEKEEVQIQQYLVTDGRAAGSLFLGEKFTQGNYLCRISSPNLIPTKWLVKDYLIPVFTPTQEEDSPGELSEETLSRTEDKRVELSQEVYTPREVVQITTTASKGKYSLSVIDVAHAEPFMENNHFLGTQQIPFSGAEVSLDLTKWNLAGKIIKASGEELPGLVGVYWVEKDTILTVRPQKGIFSIQLPYAVGRQHFQVMDSGLFPDNEFGVSWEASPLPVSADIPPIPSLEPLTSKQKQYIYWFTRRQLLNRIFQVSAPVETANTESEAKGEEPDRAYDSQEYLAFQDLESFCREVLAGAIKIDAKGSRKGFKLLNYDSKLRYQYEPLVFIDDRVLKDPSQIWEVNWKNIDKIELYATHQSTSVHFGSAGVRGGVFRLYTRGKQALVERLDFLPTSEIDGLSIQESFLPPSELAGGKPYIRPLVHWDAALDVEVEKVKATFQHSDVKGNFRIDIKGVTAEGEWVEISDTYQVQ